MEENNPENNNNENKNENNQQEEVLNESKINNKNIDEANKNNENNNNNSNLNEIQNKEEGEKINESNVNNKNEKSDNINKEKENENQNENEKKDDKNDLNDNTKINELIKEIEELKKERIILNDKNKELEEKNKELEEKCKKLEEKNRELEEKNNELNEENTKINNKLKTLKDNVLQLKTRLENDIYAKLDSKTKLLNESMSQNELLNKQNKSLNEEMEKLKLEKENFNLFREKFNTLMKEKTKNDVLSIKQEEMIKNLEGEISILNLECKEKDNRYKKLDDIYLGVIKVIEEHKKINQNLKNKLKIKEKEDKNKRLIIFQKEQEIILLRNFINSYKNDSKNKFRNGGDNVKSKLLSDNNYYKQRELPNLHKNRSSININTKNEISKTIIRTNNIPMRHNLPKVELKGNFNTSKKAINNYSNYFKKNNILDVNDKEEDNIKEITDLMKKMINE